MSSPIRQEAASGVYRNSGRFKTFKKVQVGKDQERHNQKKIPTPKTEVGKTKLTIRYLYHENIS